MVEMKNKNDCCIIEGSMFTRGDELRTRGPHGRNENINDGYMFTRGDELRARGPHGRKENIKWLHVH